MGDNDRGREERGREEAGSVAEPTHGESGEDDALALDRGAGTRAHRSPRKLAALTDLADVDFGKGDGLVVVVVQDITCGSVLMVAFANREALEATLATREMHFWSRSRNCLWRKGETSGNTLAVRELYSDCDGDAILALVEPRGPACHTGERTCFGETLPRSSTEVLAELDRTIADRGRNMPEGSYTSKLLSDRNLRVKKIGEEAAELVAALARGGGERATAEAADLFYHMLVALRAEGSSLGELANLLEARSKPGRERGWDGKPAPGAG